MARLGPRRVHILVAALELIKYPFARGPAPFSMKSLRGNSAEFSAFIRTEFIAKRNAGLQKQAVANAGDCGQESGRI